MQVTVTVSYTGAQSSSTADSHNGGNGTGTGSQSVDITTVADNCWVFSVLSQAGSTNNPTAGNTSRWEANVGAFADSAGEDTNGPKTPAGIQAMSWTVAAGSQNWTISAASFAPGSGGGGSTDHFLSLLGVGI